MDAITSAFEGAVGQEPEALIPEPNAIIRAIEIAGGPAALAKQLAVSTQAVCFWRDEKRRIPADKCPLIERATAGVVRCEDLRPDVAWDVLRLQVVPELAGEGTHA